MPKPLLKKKIAAAIAAAALLAPALSAGTGLVDEPAANYTLLDTSGQPHDLVETGRVKLLFLVGYA
jgi:hypothetical protein